MNNLESLIRSFRPRRVFAGRHTTVEMESVMVRVGRDEDGQDRWVPVSDPGDPTLVRAYEVNVEDILQDPATIRSARVSTDRDTLAVNDKAQGLESYLWRDRHDTPFEGLGLRFRIETPIMFAQPLFRLFASHNEFSGRYSELDGDYYTPERLIPGQRERFDRAEERAWVLYRKLLGMGVAKEMARLAHLYRFKTKFYMTISLRHLLEFLYISNVPFRHTTTEFYDIRELFLEVVQCWMPWAFQAWQQYSRFLNLEWIGQFRSSQSPGAYEALQVAKVLDHGEVRFLELQGSEDFMLSCLDDFPSPLSAFGHSRMKFYCSVPIHVFRQWIRHRDAIWTEPTIDFDTVVRERRFFTPELFRKQEGKVGSYTFSDMDEASNQVVRVLFAEHLERACLDYEQERWSMVNSEVAAMNLPYRFYVPMVWNVTAKSMMNFFSLRCDSHAQYEIRQYANAIWPMFVQSYPRVARIFAKHLHYGDSQLIKQLAT